MVATTSLQTRPLATLDSRSKKLGVFHHDMKIGWDMEKEEGKRTVIYESMSVTVFKNDAEKEEVKVPELNIIEMEPVEKSCEGFGAVELKSHLGTKPITQHCV